MLNYDLQNTGLIVANANVRMGTEYLAQEQYFFGVRTRKAGELFLVQLEATQGSEHPRFTSLGYDALYLLVKKNMKALCGNYINPEDPIYDPDNRGNFELLWIKMDYTLNGLGLVRYSKDTARRYELPLEYAFDYGIPPEYKRMPRGDYLKLQREKMELAAQGKVKTKKKAII